MVEDTQRDDAGREKRSQRVRQVVQDCLRRRSAGESLSDQSVIDAHPDLMPGLAEELRKLRLITVAWQEAEQGRCVDMDADTDTRRGLQIRCPHCNTPVEMVADTPFTEITCSSCGSRFSLAGDEADTRQAASISTIGHFELVERLGVGGFGTVWKARDTELDRTVTLKVPRAGQLDRLETEQFLREARAAAQLKHPNIVTVHEVGRDGDTPYIVSDLVRGISLADWLTGQRPTAAEAAKLCVTIAEALHHAHLAGVVHRDLKPANILIDAGGQPHIMDFGLAKRDAGEITLTTDGQVLGTPAYMSPEQAEGKAHQVDGRSDVYSLGVILFELLTGERPFRGNARMLIHQVINEEPPSPRKLNGTIPRDLETICLKCLEKEPARRYATAQDLAEELHRFLRGEPIQARPIGSLARVWWWCKRKPLVAGLGGTVASLLLFLAVAGPIVAVKQASLAAKETEARGKADQEAERANLAAEDAAKQRAIAQARAEEALRNFQMARKAVDEFFTQVSEAPQLKAHGLEDLRKSLLEAARKFYEDFVKRNPDDPELRAEQARAYLRLADLNLQTGRSGEAEAAYQAAEEIAKRLVAEDPNDPEHKRTLAAIYNNMGVFYHVTGKIEKAKQAYNNARDIWARLCDSPSRLPDDQLKLAASYSNLGDIYSDTGPIEDAEVPFLKALELRKVLADEYPDVSHYQYVVALSLNKLGQVYENTGRNEQSQTAYEAARDKLKPLAAQHPHMPEYQNGLAETHNKLGILYEKLVIVYDKTDRISDAETEYVAALELWTSLAKKHPRVPQYQLYQAKAHNNLGTFYLGAGSLGTDHRLDDAKVHCEHALTIWGRLATEYPNFPEHQEDLAKGHHNMGLWYFAAGQLEEAIGEYTAARAILEALVEEYPDVLEYQHNLAQCLLQIGTLYVRTGQVKQAEPPFLLARDIWVDLTKAHRGVPEYQKNLVLCYEILGILYKTIDRPEESKAAFKAARELQQPLVP